MGICLGVSNSETKRRIENRVGKDGYHEWEKMPQPLSFEDVGLPEIEYDKRQEMAAAVLTEAANQALSLFPRDGRKPFNKQALNEMLERCLFTKSKKLMKALNFSPTGRFGYPTVRAFVKEMVVETLKNDIMATALAIAHEQGVSVFNRQDPEVEGKWIVETIRWCYILHVITMTADKDVNVMKLVYDHVLAMREGPLSGWRDVATDFEYLKTISVDPAIAGMFDKKAKKVPDSNRLEAKSNLGLTMNIMEAMWGDYKAGNKENAEAGYELAVLDGLFDYTRQNNRARKAATGSMYKYSPIPRNWADLFASWDLNFIYSEFPNNCSLIMTKLFTPAVGTYSSTPERYLRPRVIALFVQINREMVDRVIGGHELPEVEWRADDFLKIWSRVNLVYAKRYRAFYEDLGKGLAGGIRKILDAASDAFVRKTWDEVKEAVDEGEPERVTKAIVSMLQLLSKLKIVDIDPDALKANKEFAGTGKEQIDQTIKEAYELYERPTTA